MRSPTDWAVLKVFCKLDAKDGFWSIHLDTPSSYLTTFNIHKGHAIGSFTCHSALKCLGMYFRCKQIKIIDKLPGIIAMHWWHLCIWQRNSTEQNRNLLQLMQTALQQGLVHSTVVSIAFASSIMYILWCSFHRVRHQIRSCKGTSFARHSFPWKVKWTFQSFLGSNDYL